MSSTVHTAALLPEAEKLQQSDADEQTESLPPVNDRRLGSLRELCTVSMRPIRDPTSLLRKGLGRLQ